MSETRRRVYQLFGLTVAEMEAVSADAQDRITRRFFKVRRNLGDEAVDELADGAIAIFKRENPEAWKRRNPCQPKQRGGS